MLTKRSAATVKLSPCLLLSADEAIATALHARVSEGPDIEIATSYFGFAIMGASLPILTPRENSVRSLVRFDFINNHYPLAKRTRQIQPQLYQSSFRRNQ